MRPPILDRVAAAGHTVFDTGSYDLNLIAIRSKNREAGSFDDKFCIAFKDVNGVWTTHWMACTTDPGLPWLEAPGRESGTAILVAGQTEARGKSTSTETNTMRFARGSSLFPSTATRTGTAR